MKKFTEIEQFRNVIRAVKSHHDYKGKDEAGEPIYLHDSPYPIIKFRGTIKLHGSNSAIVKYSDNIIKFQSRERELELTTDNAGFMLKMSNIDVNKLFEGIEFKDHCAIYGEWCGKGIQSGVAISQLEKMWVIFAIKIDENYVPIENYQHLKMEDKRIFNILQFENYHLDIDFNNPEIAQNQLIEFTEKVEKECPVGKYFGVSGIGEGIVWEAFDTDGSRYIFKVKGKEHSVSKVKTLASIDIEEIKNMKDFVEYAVTENRLKQGIDKLKEMKIPLEMKSTGDFLRWIYNDVVKEENDTIIKNQIDCKKVGKYISEKSKIFWNNFLNNQIY